VTALAQPQAFKETLFVLDTHKKQHKQKLLSKHVLVPDWRIFEFE